DEHRAGGGQRSGSDGGRDAGRGRRGTARLSGRTDAPPRSRGPLVAGHRHAGRMTDPRGGIAHLPSAGGVTEPRRIAAETCADLRRGELLDPAFEARAGHLDARDRRWLQELLYGMLRRRAVLDAHLDARVRGGLVRLDADLID